MALDGPLASTAEARDGEGQFCKSAGCWPVKQSKRFLGDGLVALARAGSGFGFGRCESMG